MHLFLLFIKKNNDRFIQIAEKLLDDVINQLSETTDITVKSGLAGIAIGISHLVKDKFIAGDINEILEDIDNRIFNRLAFLDNSKIIHSIPSNGDNIQI